MKQTGPQTCFVWPLQPLKILDWILTCTNQILYKNINFLFFFKKKKAEDIPLALSPSDN